MPKLLVIDDEEEICLVLQSFFEARGYEVVYALTGQGGIDAYEIERPGVVLLDLCLKDTSGLDVLREIKAMDPSSKVIIITGSALEDDRLKALELGADVYMCKPFSIEVLHKLIPRLRGDET